MTTTVYELTDSAWVDLGAGPLMFTIPKSDKNHGAYDNPRQVRSRVHVHVGTVSPAANSYAYHEVEDQLIYSGTENVYVQSESGDTAIKVTAIV